MKIGNFLGIPLYVHWTFSLLIALVWYMYRDHGPIHVVYGIGVLISVFVCVTLHEYGHALAARRYGIATIDITLSPIGGVARLQRMPRIPLQELVVAVAGPAVNVVIGGVLLCGLTVAAWITGVFAPPFTGELLTELSTRLDAWSGDGEMPTMTSYFITLLLVNVMLVLFNAVPAFPMDGGRVLRSILAMITDYRRATMIASRLAIVVAMLMIAFAAYSNSIQMVLVATFVIYAGTNEARQVEITEAVRGLFVKDVYINDTTSVGMDADVRTLDATWQTTTATSIPVVSVVGSVIGIVHLSALVSEITTVKDSQATAGMMAEKGVALVSLNTPLEEAIFSADRRNRRLPVVDGYNRLVGIIDIDTAIQRAKLCRMYAASEPTLRPLSIAETHPATQLDMMT